MYATLSNIRIVKGTITIPFWGCWHADLTLDTDTSLPPGPQMLVLADLKGTCSVIRDVDFTKQRGVRVVGGYGGWRKPVAAKQYQNPGQLLLSTVLQDVALENGEQVSVLADRSVGVTYIRGEGIGRDVLQELAEDAWYVGLDGITHVAPRIPVPVVNAFMAVAVQMSGGLYGITSEKPGEWQPGNTFKNSNVSGTISRVTHRITSERLSTDVSTVAA